MGIKNIEPLDIFITSGVAESGTELSAFDGALVEAGVANFNLLHLSSIIPFGGKVVIGKPPGLYLPEKIGNKLYVVYARQNENEHGMEACAGLGWVFTVKDPRYGLFVEHAGASEEDVKREINKSLYWMTEQRERKFGHIFGEMQHLTASIACKNIPVCAVVVAVFKDESW